MKIEIPRGRPDKLLVCDSSILFPSSISFFRISEVYFIPASYFRFHFPILCCDIFPPHPFLFLPPFPASLFLSLSPCLPPFLPPIFTLLTTFFSCFPLFYYVLLSYDRCLRGRNSKVRMTLSLVLITFTLQ